MWGAIPKYHHSSQHQTGPENNDVPLTLEAIQEVEEPLFSSRAQGSVFESEKQWLLVCGQPLWPSAKLRQLASEYSPAYTLKQLSEKQGLDAALSQVGGHFSVINWHKQTAKLILATDRFNQWPLYYRLLNHPEAGESLYFSSHLKPLLKIAPPADLIDCKANTQSSCGLSNKKGEETPGISPQAVYDYLYFHMLPSPNSSYTGLQKLPGGHYLHWQLGQTTATVKRYWRPSFQEGNGATKQESYPRVRALLRASIDRICDANPTPIAAFLSGGLDSSSVAGMLAERSREYGQRAQAYTIGFNAPGYDEVPYARITARHFDLDLHEYYVTPADVVDALPKIAASLDEPFGNSSALPAYFCAKRAASNGTQHLLAGDGGDELFAGNERYQKQALFERYQQLPSSLRHGLIEPLLPHLPGGLFDKVRSYVKQSNIPLPERLEYYNFLHQHTPDSIWQPNLFAQLNTDAPLQHLHSTYNQPQQASTLNRMLHLDWKLTLADNDLKKVGSMCQLAGVHVHYPMLDTELVDFSCQLPSHWKIKGRQLRHFYKESMRGWLADATLNKSKKGFGLPFGVWLTDHPPLQELAYSCLEQLKQRGYFQEDFIDRSISYHQKGDAAYYGELIWVLMMLELWIQSHKDTVREIKHSDNIIRARV